VNIDGGVEATKGQVVVRNNNSNANPGILLDGNAYLAGDIVKVGALGTSGVLQINSGAFITADTQALLYGGGNPGGAIKFVGGGSVTISSPETIMRAHTVEVQNGMSVNVGTGAMSDIVRIFADTRHFGIGGFGNVFINGDFVPNSVTFPSEFPTSFGNYQIGTYADGAGFPFD